MSTFRGNLAEAAPENLHLTKQKEPAFQVLGHGPWPTGHAPRHRDLARGIKMHPGSGSCRRYPLEGDVVRCRLFASRGPCAGR